MCTLASSFCLDVHAQWHCRDFEWEYMKEEGNKFFKQGDFKQALRWYRSGIIICPPGKDRALLHRQVLHFLLHRQVFHTLLHRQVLHFHYITN